MENSLRKSPAVTEYTVNAGLEKELTFAFVTDLHACDNEPVITVIKDVKVDAILIGGDIIHNSKYYRQGLDFLNQAVKIAPVFCALGNHEVKCPRAVKVARCNLIMRTGAVLLDNAFVYFRGITIGGLSSGFSHLDIGKRQKKKPLLIRKAQYMIKRFGKSPAPDLVWLKRFSEENGFKLLLSHHPEYYEEYIDGLDIDMTLSGHAHGGQWRIFGHGIFSPGQGFFPKYTSGEYFDGRLIVSRGLGNKTSVPRINNREELIVLHIK